LAVLNVFNDRRQHFLKFFVLRLVLDLLKRILKRQTGVDHDREVLGKKHLFLGWHAAADLGGFFLVFLSYGS